MEQTALATKLKIIAWTAAAAAAVAAGLFFADWRARQPVDAPAAAEMQADSDRLVRQMQDDLNERVRGETTSDQQERMDSPLGQALFRRCSDWTDLAAADRNPETERNRAAACREFRDYVLTGAMPE